MLREILFFVASLTTATVFAHDGPANSFAIAFEQAWELSQQELVSRRRMAAIAAREQTNRSWFAAPPELRSSFTTDRLNNDLGNDEYELEIEAPLWQSGRRDAIGKRFKAAQAAEAARLDTERLKLAGEVRELYWDIALKRNELALAERQLSASHKIAEDIERQVNSGRMAKADLLLIQAEVLGAEAERLSAQQALDAAQAHYGARTRSLVAGHWALEREESPGPIKEHPHIQQAMIHVALARSKHRLAQIEGREPTHLGLGWSREREARDEPFRERIQIAFSVPLGKTPQFHAELERSAAELLEAEAQLQTTKRTLETQIRVASSALATSRHLEQRAQLKYATSQQRYQMHQTAFTTGELSLQALLESRNASDAAKKNWERHRIESARAVSSLNQALGYLPRSSRQKRKQP